MVIFKTRDEIAKIRKANQIVAKTLTVLSRAVAPGVTTLELDTIAENEIRAAGAIPAFKGYRGYPATLCASVNEEIVHGIPSANRMLKEGDIIGLDLGAVVDGLYGDAALTVPVGEVSPEAGRLIDVTRQSLAVAIDAAKNGNRIGDIGYAVQTFVEKQGYSVVRDFVGHGIGRSLHEDPQVPNYGNPGQGHRIKPGMVLAIEPMVCQGKSDVEVLADNWTAVTRDRSLSAHFEHSIVITDKGPVILSTLED